LLSQAHVEFLGEISEQQKLGFLSGARALLFPTDWPEPFGLVMIEAMACGTPMIAFNRGSVPEVVDHGVTGCVYEDVQGAVGALQRLDDLSRTEIRAQFERRFSARTMARNFLDSYTPLLQASRRPVFWQRARLQLCTDDSPRPADRMNDSDEFVDAPNVLPSSPLAVH
jgi:glycosyltransferase involved in cell wall biosynthesis